MPDPISRSSVSQIASYAPPEDISCEPPPAVTVAKPSLPATTKHPPPTALGALVGCVGGGLGGMVAAVSQGTASGATEGKIACDDLPRKP